MIWICTLFLLVVAAWLFFNALNERRWVQAHSHDETVAADEGLFASFTARTGSGSLPADGKLSIDQENTFFASAVRTVRGKTTRLGDRFIESRLAAARIDDPEKRPRSASEENTLFGRAIVRVNEKTRRMSDNLEMKIRQASSQTTRSTDTSGHQEGVLARASRKVATTADELKQLVSNRGDGITKAVEDTASVSEANGLLDRVIDKVADSVEKFETRLDEKVASAHPSAATAEKDLVARVASKIDSTVNKMDKPDK